MGKDAVMAAGLTVWISAESKLLILSCDFQDILEKDPDGRHESDDSANIQLRESSGISLTDGW